MHFNCRLRQSCKRIAQGNAVMSQRAWINNHAITLWTGLLQRINQRALKVRLKHYHLAFEFTCFVLQHSVDLFQCDGTIDFRLSRSQHIEIRTMKYEYFYHAFLSWYVLHTAASASRTTSSGTSS